jgi:hypothetical protein
MAYFFGIGCGGCVQIFNPSAGAALFVTDSDLLPPSQIQIAVLLLDGTAYPIYDEFADKSALVSYLNTTFDAVYNLPGYWELQGGGIAYTNPSNLSTSEIVAIIKQETTVFKIGSPQGTVRPGLTVVDIAQGFPITSSRLIGVDPDSVLLFSDNQYQAQLSDVFALDTTTGTITFAGSDPTDQYLYVHHSQQLSA